MPDISMCVNKECKSRSTCYRYITTASEYWQWYADFKPAEGEDKCFDYIPVDIPKVDKDDKNICMI